MPSDAASSYQSRPVPEIAGSPWRAAALFVALTLFATYPIVRAPASLAYFSHSDAQLNMWIMAWEAHALRVDPSNLLNANIFYPARGTLLYSETLLGYLPIFGPILWLHGSPPLAFNAVWILSFVASGFGMYLLARRLTGREWPAIVAGILYAFLPFRFVHVPQIQLEAMEWFPLAFLGLHLFIERGGVRYAAGCGAAVVLGTLCCVYYGVFLWCTLAVGLLALVILDSRARDTRKLVTLALAASVAAACLAPLFVAYSRVSQRTGLERSLTEIRERSADLTSYTSSGARVHQALGMVPPAPPHDYLFPGFLALALGAVGLATSFRSRWLWLYVAIGVFGWAASLGPDGLYGFSLFGPLYGNVPVFRGLRQISRFGVVALFALCVLAAFGCAALQSLVPRRRALWQLVVAALAFLELLQAPLRFDRPGGDQFVRVPDAPEVYRWLGRQSGQFAILEFPLPHLGVVWRNASYVYWSTEHWHPLVNGYSGFASPAYASVRRIFNEFPDDLSRAALEMHDVRYVIVHWSMFGAGDPRIDVARLERTAWLRHIARFGDDEVFEVLQPRASAAPDPR